MSDAAKYDYSFSVWPDESNPRLARCRALFELFKVMNQRCILDMTERQFGEFREELKQVGFTLREIERQPHHTPESVR